MWPPSEAAVTAVPAPEPTTRATLGGAPVDLMERPDAVATILAAARAHDGPALAVASANLDHLHHFGHRGRWGAVLESSRGVRWLTLLDGHPLVARARHLDGGRRCPTCGRSAAWPRLAGSDLIEELLDQAQQEGISVGFLGGTEEAQELLREQVAQRWPRLEVRGYWAPDRSTVVESDQARKLAREVELAGPELLFVGLGKPRQELWIAEHGAATGARVLLAFGASADFVAGTVRRAPGWVARSGLEWLWRLSREPRRLATRYLLQGPPAYAELWLHSSAHTAGMSRPAPPSAHAVTDRPRVTAIVVTYNSAAHVGALLDDLAQQQGAVAVRTIVVDNGSTDQTVALVRAAGVELIETRANLGYAGAINVGLRARGPGEAVLLLNPDLRLGEDAVDAMWRSLAERGAGAVVPRMEDGSGNLYPSLRFEPTILGGLADAVLGSRLVARPAPFADIDRDPQSYEFPHPVEWATGAAILVSEAVMRAVGEWNEDFFLYCEETDFFRRLRGTGASVWYDPAARVRHDAHGSGSSPQLDALMAVNRVRYAQLHHGRAYAEAMRGVAILCELVRSPKDEAHRCALRHLVNRRTWDRLPRAGTLPAVAVGSAA